MDLVTSATAGMSHIALQEWQDGAPVTCLEPVSEEAYLSGVLLDSLG